MGKLLVMLLLHLLANYAALLLTLQYLLPRQGNFILPLLQTTPLQPTNTPMNAVALSFESKSASHCMALHTSTSEFDLFYTSTLEISIEHTQAISTI